MSTPHNHWAQLASSTSTKAASATSAEDENLAFLEELCSGKYSAATKARLKRAAEAFLDPFGKATFGEAIGLKNAPYLPGWQSRRRLAQSRAALRDAWALVASDNVIGWARAEKLSAEIKQFADQFWPTWSQMDSPPRGASKLRRALHSAFKAKNGKVAKTARQLYSVMVVLDQAAAIDAGTEG